MLKLKGLSHGQYTIRLTVTDEQGETNSTMATVNVEEVKSLCRVSCCDLCDPVSIEIIVNLFTMLYGGMG